MAVAPPTDITLHPFPLGKIAVAVPGTIQRLTKNFPNAWKASPDNLNNILANKVMVQALPGNAGLVYVGSSTMVRATGVGVLFVLVPGASYAISHPVGLGKYSVGDLCVDVDTGNDAVYAHCDVV